MVMHRALGRCEVQVVPSCRPGEPEWHHRQRRGHAHDHAPSNGIAGCRPCHSYIHAHPEESRDRGWIVPTTTSPAVVPALVRRRGVDPPQLVTLTPGGTYI